MPYSPLGENCHLTGQQTFIARGVLGIATAAISVFAVSNGWLRRLPSTRFDRLASSAFLFSRLGLYFVVFLAAHIAPRGDVPSYYLPEAASVLHGLLPYRDFYSSYAPLHPYLDAIPASLWHSPLSIILFAILAESLLLPLWFRFGRRFLTEAELRSGAILYVTSAVSLQFVTIDGQDTVMIAVLLTLSLLLLTVRREVLSGISVGASIAAIKFLPVLFVPAFFFVIPRRWRWALGFLLPIAAVYGVAIGIHLPILEPVYKEGSIRSAGNLPYLIETLCGISLPSSLWDGLLIAAFVIIVSVAVHTARSATPATRLRILAFSIAAITLALLLFSKKSWPPYLMLGLFPICLLIDETSRLHISLFAVLNVFAVLEHSYWATFLHQLSSLELHQGLSSLQSNCFVLLALQITILGCYGWLLTLSLRQIGGAPQYSRQAYDSKPDMVAIEV